MEKESFLVKNIPLFPLVWVGTVEGGKKREGKNGLNSQQFLFLATTELFYTLNLYHYKTYYLSSSE